jgi:hypothetical protein
MVIPLLMVVWQEGAIQHVRIIRGIGLISLVGASLLLCSGRSFQPTPKLYRAKPEDVPQWAEQGDFRFIRLDGGRIESWKADRTWWGKKFTREQKDVLSHIYDRDFEKMLGLLKQADFNWIWVTWSNGWSAEEEDENRENLKQVIGRVLTAMIRKRSNTACGCMAFPCSTPARQPPICTSPGIDGWPTRANPAGGPMF